MEKFRLNPTHWIYNSPFNPGNVLMSKIFVWCPLQHYQMELLCPSHKSPLVFHSWTTQLTHQSPHNPRLVYDLNGNIILVQSIYRCPYNLADLTSSGHEFYSATTDILKASHEYSRTSFLLRHFIELHALKICLTTLSHILGADKTFWNWLKTLLR